MISTYFKERFLCFFGGTFGIQNVFQGIIRVWYWRFFHHQYAFAKAYQPLLTLNHKPTGDRDNGYLKNHRLKNKTVQVARGCPLGWGVFPISIPFPSHTVPWSSQRLDRQRKVSHHKLCGVGGEPQLDSVSFLLSFGAVFERGNKQLKNEEVLVQKMWFLVFASKSQLEDLLIVGSLTWLCCFLASETSTCYHIVGKRIKNTTHRLHWNNCLSWTECCLFLCSKLLKWHTHTLTRTQQYVYKKNTVKQQQPTLTAQVLWKMLANPDTMLRPGWAGSGTAQMIQSESTVLQLNDWWFKNLKFTIEFHNSSLR